MRIRKTSGPFWNGRPERKQSMKRKQIVIVIIALAVMWCGWQIGTGECKAAENRLITCWALCKPGSHIEVHISPNKDSQVVGRLDPMDSFHTDGESRNGFIWCDVGESCGGWIYCGYVSTEKPEAVYERYVCVAKKQVACRRWISGPQIKGRAGWLTNMSTVEVFYRTESWCVTSRGYIRSEWLEPDPE